MRVDHQRHCEVVKDSVGIEGLKRFDLGSTCRSWQLCGPRPQNPRPQAPDLESVEGPETVAAALSDVENVSGLCKPSELGCLFWSTKT